MGKVISVAMTFKDAFSNPCKNTIRNLKTMGKEAQMTGRTIQNAGKTISKAGSTLTKTVTLPIVGIGVAAVKTASEFEASMSNVKAITGASGKEFESLRKQAIDLGGSTAWSAKEVSEAMQYTGMAGWKAKDNMAGLKGILDAASATGADLARTSDIMTDAIAALGDKANSSARYADVLTAACQNSNVNMESLGEAYKNCTSIAGALGYSIEDVTLSIGAMSSSVKGSAAGTAVKNILTNMAAPTKSTKEAMDKLGISLTDENGKVIEYSKTLVNIRQAFKGYNKEQQTAYAKAIAGKTGMTGLLAIVNQSDKDFNKLTKAIKNSGGAADTAAKTQLDNLQGQLTLLKSATEKAAIIIGNKLLPYFKKLTTRIQGVADWFNKLSDKQVSFIMKCAGIAAAVGPVLLIIGKLVRTVGTVVSVFGKISKAVSAAGSVMSLITSPAGIVIAVVAALAIVAIIVIKNWSKIKPVFMKVVTFLKTTFGPIFKQIGQMIKTSVVPIVKVLMGAVKQLLPVLKSVFQQALKAVIPIIKSLMSAFKACAPYIKSIFGTAIKILGTLFKSLGKIIKAVAPIFVKIFGAQLKMVGKIIQAVAKVIQKVFVPIFKKVLPVVFKIVSVAFKVVGAVFKVVAGIITKVVTGIASFIKGAFNVIKKVITTVMAFIVPPVRTAFNIIKKIISGVANTIKSIINGIKNVFSGIVQFVSGVFTGNWKKAWNGIKKIFSSIWETLGNVCKKPLNFIIGLINKVINFINSKLKVKVPKWVPKLGGKTYGVHIPTIPQLAHGTMDWQGGLAQVHERGGEIIDLPKGSRVYPHDESIKKARKEANKTTNINISKIADKVVINNDQDIDTFVDTFANKLKLVYDNM